MAFISIIAILFSVQLSRTFSMDCPPNYTEYSGHCYRISSDRGNWTEARETCQSEGGDLVSVNDKGEDDFLRKGLQDVYKDDHRLHNYWMGMVYTSPGGRYQWLDGTDVGYTNWASGDPGCMKYGECKAVYSHMQGDKWEDTFPKYNLFYICEQNAPAAFQYVCPASYDEYKGHCYSIKHREVNYTEARKACQSQGADLVSVNSQEEDTFLGNKLRKAGQAINYWIGLEFTNNSLMWVDGSNLSYSNWAINHPNCMNESGRCYGRYSNFYNFSSWEDGGASMRLGFICELNATITTVQPVTSKVTRVQHVTASVAANITKHGSSSGEIQGSPVDIKLYTDSAFSQPLQGTVKLGTPVYVQVLSLINPDVAMVVDSCEADIDTSLSQNSRPYPLIINHCNVDPGTHIIVVKNQVTRFSFNMFDLPEDNDGIYVTCNIVFCHPLDFSAQCGQMCNSPSNLVGSMTN